MLGEHIEKYMRKIKVKETKIICEKSKQILMSTQLKVYCITQMGTLQ